MHARSLSQRDLRASACGWHQRRSADWQDFCDISGSDLDVPEKSVCRNTYRNRVIRRSILEEELAEIGGREGVRRDDAQRRHALPQRADRLRRRLPGKCEADAVRFGPHARVFHVPRRNGRTDQGADVRARWASEPPPPADEPDPMFIPAMLPEPPALLMALVLVVEVVAAASLLAAAQPLSSASAAQTAARAGGVPIGPRPPPRRWAPRRVRLAPAPPAGGQWLASRRHPCRGPRARASPTRGSRRADPRWGQSHHPG